ncbi:hypothetical protein [Salinarimonas sp.]|uniref:hypothetical protein n=1 Tax=Salinarimonas sp. TaxID=2766526 RepID=UPI00391DFE6E
MRMALALGAAVALLAGGMASAADLARVPTRAPVTGSGTPPAEQRVIPYSGVIPTCDAPAVLAEINRAFDRRESRFWDSPLRIVGFEHPRLVAHRPWSRSFVPRNFCSATALVQEGPHMRRHEVAYIVREETGYLFGSTWKVDWCVTGVERHLHAAPNCRMMRP